MHQASKCKKLCLVAQYHPESEGRLRGENKSYRFLRLSRLSFPSSPSRFPSPPQLPARPYSPRLRTSPAMSVLTSPLNHRTLSSKSSLSDKKDNDWSTATETPGTNGLSVFDDPVLAK